MSTEIAFKTAGYYSFAVEVEKVNLHSIDNALEQAYLKMKVDPQYLFISQRDYKNLSEEVERHANHSGHHDFVEKSVLTKYINQTTGKLMDIVSLPNAEPNIILFGFITP